jgi:hypothetical protein
MPTETGHIQNLASFEALISFSTSYGATYSPSKTALKLANLKTLLTDAQAALSNCAKKQTENDNAIDIRRDTFNALKPLSTRIVNALAVSGVPDSVIEGAKTINRKIQGTRAKAIPKKSEKPDTPLNPNAPKNISAAQSGLNDLIEHLNSLIELAGSHTEYNPSETDLKLADLKTYLKQLKTVNTNAINTQTAYKSSLVTRDKLLYTPNTGLVDIAIDSKNYIKSVFGANSPEYAQVRSLKFRNR